MSFKKIKCNCCGYLYYFDNNISRERNFKIEKCKCKNFLIKMNEKKILVIPGYGFKANKKLYNFLKTGIITKKNYPLFLINNHLLEFKMAEKKSKGLICFNNLGDFKFNDYINYGEILLKTYLIINN